MGFGGKRTVCGAIALMLAAITPHLARAATWERASSPHFVIYAQEGSERLRAFAGKLEWYDSAMRYIRGLGDPPISPSNRLTVFVVSSPAVVQKLMTQGRGGASNVYGFYEPRAGHSFVIVPRDAGGQGITQLNPQIVLLHEYAHHFMYRYYTGAFPPWFVEGFAEYCSTAKFDPDGSVGLGLPAMHRAYGLSDPGIDIWKMVTNQYTKMNDRQEEGLYSQGWLLTHYLMFEPSRKGQLSAYLAKINHGTSIAEAAKVFGEPKVLDRDLFHYVNRSKMSYYQLPAAKIKPAKLDIEELSPGASAIMDVKIRSQRGVDAKTAPLVAAEMRSRAAPYPNDPFVQRALAQTEFDVGNLDASEAAADRALAANPKEVGAMLYEARVRIARAAKDTHANAATWHDARHWLLAANAVENDAPEPLLMFYRSFEAAKAKPSKNAVDALYEAQHLAPEDPGLRIVVAHQHLIDGEADEARAALAIVAYDPHGGAAAQWASAMLKTIDTGGASAAMAAWDKKPSTVDAGS